jgi:hypothetical protein
LLFCRVLQVAEYVVVLADRRILDENQTLWAACFSILGSCPKAITVNLQIKEFGTGVYSMLLRTNMRTEIGVQSAKIVTVEKDDRVYVVEAKIDSATGIGRNHSMKP